MRLHVYARFAQDTLPPGAATLGDVLYSADRAAEVAAAIGIPVGPKGPIAALCDIASLALDGARRLDARPEGADGFEGPAFLRGEGPPPAWAVAFRQTHKGRPELWVVSNARIPSLDDSDISSSVFSDATQGPLVIGWQRA